MALARLGWTVDAPAIDILWNGLTTGDLGRRFHPRLCSSPGS